jgi:hypothetical protein
MSNVQLKINSSENKAKTGAINCKPYLVDCSKHAFDFSHFPFLASKMERKYGAGGRGGGEKVS